jgi:hypothetical protein
MGYIKGEDINLGVARETVRGTPETPSAWVPARTPTGVRVMVEKTPIRETKGTGINSQGSTIVQKRSEGDLEFNVRNGSIGFFLLSLLGKVTTSANGAVYDHLFEVLTGNAQYPTLTLGMAQLGQQDYEYERVLVNSLELRTPVDDLINATVGFIGVDEATHADYSPSYGSDDYFFRHYDVTLKIAADVAGLGAASALKVKEFSLSINNSGRVNQNISELNPGDVLALMLEITGGMKIDYDGETHHDLYVNNTSRAMSITLTRSDVDIDTGVNPQIEIILPNITYTSWTPERPLDDIVTQDIQFTAHYDDAEAEAIHVTVTNEIANYN